MIQGFLGLSGISSFKEDTYVVFFCELATLIDIMLFGHWIEMKSVTGAGKALEQLASLIPDVAHKVRNREMNIGVIYCEVCASATRFKKLTTFSS